jgi:hypothetical protein
MLQAAIPEFRCASFRVASHPPPARLFDKEDSRGIFLSCRSTFRALAASAFPLPAVAPKWNRLARHGSLPASSYCDRAVIRLCNVPSAVWIKTFSKEELSC